jgi:hypothetical protein
VLAAGRGAFRWFWFLQALVIAPFGLAKSSSARRDPAYIASARVIDRRRVAARRLAARDAPARIVARHRAAAVGRGVADDIAARIVEGALLRRRCAGSIANVSRASRILVMGFVIRRA